MRTAGQVLAAAGNADRALGAGLGRDRLVLLAVARQRLAAGDGVFDDLQPGLRAAVAHPAAPLFDELLVRRLSDRLPTIGASWR